MTNEEFFGGGLLGIALAEVHRLVTPSARSNVADDIAARAVEEYLSVAERVDVESPEAMIRVIARRRAIDEMRNWRQRKERQERIEDDYDSEYVEFLSDSLVRALAQPDTSFDRVVREDWISELFEAALADPSDREIAWKSFVDGDPPRDIAMDLGLEPKTVSNRLSMIRAKLRELLGPSALAD